MIFDIFKSSPTKSLTIAYSQVKNFSRGNFEIVDFPEIKYNMFTTVFPGRTSKNFIALFIGGNDFFGEESRSSSSFSSGYGATGLKHLANIL